VDNTDNKQPTDLLKYTTTVVSAYLSKNTIPSDQLPDLINTIYNNLSKIGGVSSESIEEMQKPAVPIRRSVTHDYLICLEDGKKLKMLKRYLRTAHGLTPEEYRKKWGLPADYPMVAPSYAARRSEFAKKIGLGRSGRS